MASARASSCWLAGALPAAASAVAAAWSAMRRRTAVSVIAGQGGGGLLAFEVGHRAGQGGEHAALAGPGVHAHGHEQAQRLAPAGPGLDLDRAGGDGGEHGQGEHAGQVGWGLGGGGDRGHVLAQPAGQDLDRERGHLAGDPERDGRLPAAPTVARWWCRPARRPGGRARPGRRRSGPGGCRGRSPAGGGRSRRPAGRSGRRWPRWARPATRVWRNGPPPTSASSPRRPAPPARSPGRWAGPRSARRSMARQMARWAGR